MGGRLREPATCTGVPACPGLCRDPSGEQEPLEGGKSAGIQNGTDKAEAEVSSGYSPALTAPFTGMLWGRSSQGLPRTYLRALGVVCSKAVCLHSLASAGSRSAGHWQGRQTKTLNPHVFAQQLTPQKFFCLG